MPDFKRNPTPVTLRKVMVIDFRPAAVPAQWNSTDNLIQQYIATMRQATANLLIYEVENKVTVPNYPVLLDGRQYNDTTWAQANADDKTAFRDSHGSYMLADYQRILNDYKILPAVASNQIDEVWMFGGPYYGFYESRMVGKGAFWCNAPGIEMNSRLFIMMGFNYQRDVKEMVHDFGHRAESMLAMQFGSQNFLQQLYAQTANMPAPKNDYEKFLLANGTVHRKPGGADYGQDELAWVTALKPEWFPPAIDPNKVH